MIFNSCMIWYNIRNLHYVELMSAVVLKREVNGLAKREERGMATTLYSKKSTGNQAERGFTLAELLIVVAIIGVLTAMAIPVFTNQLEKSREATDAANIRAAYAAVMAEALADTNTIPGFMAVSGVGDVQTTANAVVTLKQKQQGWQNEEILNSLVQAFNESRYDVSDALQGVDKDLSVGIAWIPARYNAGPYADMCLVSIFDAGTGSGSSSSGGTAGNDTITTATLLTAELKANAIKTFGCWHANGQRPKRSIPYTNEGDELDVGVLYQTGEHGDEKYYFTDGVDLYKWSDYEKNWTLVKPIW